MSVSSERANKRAEEVVYFAHRHPWAKYPCLAAVSVIYSAEFVRLKINEIGERAREAVDSSAHSVKSRIAAAVLSGAFAFMAVPFCEITAYAEEPAVTAAETSDEEAPSEPAENETDEKELPKPWTNLNLPKKYSRTPEELAEMITLEGLAETNEDYRITLNFNNLKKDITVRFRESPRYLEEVVEAFGRYDISCEALNIRPVDVTVYSNDEKRVQQLVNGHSADITLPIPEDMKNHLDDLKIIRLEDDGSIYILDGEVSGGTITFNTDHFSVFALVTYKDPEIPKSAENIASGAGMTASAVPQAAVFVGNMVFSEDRRRSSKKRKRKIYRIKRVAKENQLLLI